MINYIILSGVLLVVFAAIQLGQNIYISKLSNGDNQKEIKRMAFWGTIVSSTMIAVGLVIIGISVFTLFQAPAAKQATRVAPVTKPQVAVAKPPVAKAKAHVPRLRPIAPVRQKPPHYVPRAAREGRRPTFSFSK